MLCYQHVASAAAHWAKNRCCFDAFSRTRERSTGLVEDCGCGYSGRLSIAVASSYIQAEVKCSARDPVSRLLAKVPGLLGER